MRILCFILSFHILSANLSAVAEPLGLHLEWLCCEAAAETHEPDQADSCNPFVLCHCCYGFLPASLSLSAGEVYVSPAHHAIYREDSYSRPGPLVWHPPQVR